MSVDKTLLLEAINIMSSSMIKILRVNLTTERHEIVKCHPAEETVKSGCTTNIGNWFENLVKMQMISPDDSDSFQKFVEMHKLRKYFYMNDTPISITYRRKVQGYNDYRWVRMQLVKSERATANSLLVWLFVQDVHDNHIEEMAYLKLLEYTSTHDEQTGLKNLAEYKRVAKEFNSRIHAGSVGIACVSMIGLNLINKLDGHEVGDRAIEQFAQELKQHFHDYECYRIGGDEFLIMDFSEKSTLFEMTVHDFKEKLQWKQHPVAAVGWYYQTNPNTIEAVTRIAKESMQANKDKIYEQNEQNGYADSSIEYSFKKGMIKALSVLSEEYNSVYWIDLERDSYRIFKKDHSGIKFEQPLNDKGIYSKMYPVLLNGMVEKNQAEELEEQLDIMSLRNMFNDDEEIDFYVTLKNNEYRHVVFRKLDSHNGRPVKLIMYTKTADKPKTTKIKRKKKSSLWDIIENKIK